MTTSQTAIYFASTSLDLRRRDRSGDYPRDVFIGDVCYRAVDPPYFAWLRRNMVIAQRRFEAGRLPQSTWESLRCQFNRLLAWAISFYGKEQLQAALRETNPARYSPPVNRQPAPFLFPTVGDWKFTEAVSPKAASKVDAIREVAKARGWSDANLYQNRSRFGFPLGHDFGLVCFIAPGDRLGAVTEESIEIIHDYEGRRGAPTVLRFFKAGRVSKRIQPRDHSQVLAAEVVA